nr:reverse transcriptase domain-containing protein [Tanacetum cinerariifolium]
MIESEVQFNKTQEQFNIIQEQFNTDFQNEIYRLQETLNLRNSNQDPSVDLYDLKGSDEGGIEIDLLTKKPFDTLLMGDEVISTTHERENDEFIKSSVDDLVPIPRESELTSISVGFWPPTATTNIITTISTPSHATPHHRSTQHHYPLPPRHLYRHHATTVATTSAATPRRHQCHHLHATTTFISSQPSRHIHHANISTSSPPFTTTATLTLRSTSSLLPPRQPPHRHHHPDSRHVTATYHHHFTPFNSENHEEKDDSVCQDSLEKPSRTGSHLGNRGVYPDFLSSFPSMIRSKQRIENSNLEEQYHLIVTMTDNRTMAELLRAPTEGYAEAIVVPPILAEQFKLKHSLINMMTTDQFFRLEKDNPHDHIHQDSLNAAAGGNLLERSTQDVLTIIENKSKTSLSNQTNEIKNMMASLLQINTASTSGSRSLPSNTVANPKGELKAITTRSGLVIDEPTVPTPSRSINPEEDERVEETFTNPDLVEYTIKVSPPPAQKYKPPSQREFVIHQRDPRYPNIPYPSRMLKQKQQEKDEIQIYKFWQMFKQLHINITLADALILMPKYQKMLKALLSNKEKLQDLANTPLNENCSAVFLKKLLEKLEDHGKFLIPCDFSELKCKSLADLESPFILGRPFLRTARALIDIHGEEMILRDGDKRLTLNMRHDTSIYSNQPQKESINLINVFNNSSKDFLEDLFAYQPSGNPTFSLHPELTSPEVNNDIFDLVGCNVLSEKLLDLDSTIDLHPSLHDNPSGSTTYPLLEEFADELPPEYDDNLPFDIDDQNNRAHLADIFVDSIPAMFTDEHTLDYSSPSIFDVYADDFLEVESDTGNVYDDPFDSKGEKIKKFKLLIDELDLPCDFLPPSEYDSFISQDFSRVDALPSTNNEDKIFNPGILIQEKPVEINTRVVQDKKLAISNASLVFEDFDPPFYEHLFFKEVPKSKMLLLFLSENEEKVFKPGIHTSEKVHSYFIPELSHQGYKVFKITQSFKSMMKNFLFYCGKDTHILAVPHHHFYPLD